jgi:hypothetical protein
MKSIIPRRSPTDRDRARIVPTHAEISIEAAVLWRQKDCPVGCDEAIWLEAERQLNRVGRSYRAEQKAEALADPLSRLDPNSDDVMGELEELFPEAGQPKTTS